VIDLAIMPTRRKKSPDGKEEINERDLMEMKSRQDQKGNRKVENWVVTDREKGRSGILKVPGKVKVITIST